MPSAASTVGGNQSVEELRRELAEAREQQVATADILRVISKPTDLRRVFAEIATSAARLCDAYDAVIRQVDGEVLHLVAHHGPIPQAATLPLARGLVTGRAVLDRQTIHLADVQAEFNEYPEGTDHALRLGHHTILAVPVIGRGDAIGVISIRRTEVHPFTDRQIDLLKTFADQAVIAIENARLFEEVQARTRELADALEQQSATGEVLSVISTSPTDTQPVFSAIAKNAVRLCNAMFGAVFSYDGRLVHLVAGHQVTDDALRLWREEYPIPPRGLIHRAITDRAIVNVADMFEDPRVANVEVARALGNRSQLVVPMLQGDQVIGTINVYGAEPVPFTDAQIALLETFADQAVIAIENTRLFEAEQASKRELQESLEYQTAVSDVLGVISRTPNELQPVLDVIVETAGRLCKSEFATVYKLQDGKYSLAATNRSDPTVVQLLRAQPVTPGRGTIVGRAALERRTVHVPDCRADPEWLQNITWHEAQRVGKHRTMLGVPLLRNDVAIGVILLVRTVVMPFSGKEIELVTTFADQAVIAIENTRLFEAEQASKRELQESLQQQTATADVLKVISRATFDLPRVLDTLVQSAATLCDSNDTAIWQKDGNMLRVVSRRGHIPLTGRGTTVPVTRGYAIGRAVLDRQTIHVADVQSQTDDYPEASALARRLGDHSVLAVPLVGAGEVIGVIHVRRSEVRPFTDRQIELLQTFADQAVIAIENTRLFEEVQARTRELAKTVQDLEIASQHKNQFVANMSHELRTPLAAILGYAELMQEGFYDPLGQKSLDALTRIRSNGKHLLGLINTVLDIAKIESGQFSLNLAEYAIESVVETVRAATESLAETKKLALKTEVAKSMPFGLGDEQRLAQVLLNLVGNAIKFTDAGEVRIAAGARNGHFAISVTDTGSGIPLDQQDRIFDQFHQVDSSLTKAKGGTGLGLAIAKQIVEMHGGRIWVESTVGKGSTFQIEIPTRAEFRKRGL